MAQRYTHPVALERMDHNLCPECGLPAPNHSGDMRFWTRGGSCDLLPHGVTERIAQRKADRRHAPVADPSGNEGGQG